MAENDFGYRIEYSLPSRKSWFLPQLAPPPFLLRTSYGRSSLHVGIGTCNLNFKALAEWYSLHKLELIQSEFEGVSHTEEFIKTIENE